MISLENFYHLVQENYCTDNASQLYVPRTPGDKLVGQFTPRTANGLHQIPRNLIKPIWMYDQEPVYPSCISFLIDLAEEFFDNKDFHALKNANWAQVMPFLQTSGRTHHFPMWCHSEISSKEINDLQQNYFITVYYWYHAFISLDWYRHVQYNKRLAVQNKSRVPYRFLLYARAFTGTRTYRKQIIQGLLSHQQTIRYDWTGKNDVSSHASSDIDLADAATSAIHLVAETLFDDQKIYLTEKVFKPIVMSQPFILWAPPGSLAYMRQYGFRTFSHVWPEDYDLILDPQARMQRLLEIVDRLANLPADHFDDLYKKCLETIDHNRRWFYGREFQDRCWRELEQNFTIGLACRSEMEQQHPGGILCRIAGENPEIYSLGYFKHIVRYIIKNLNSHQQRQVLAAYPHFND